MDKLQRVLCSIFIFIAIVISGSKVYAKDGLLSGIVISDNQNSGYEITLKTNKKASFTQKNISNNKIIIKLKGITPSDKTNAVYQNASNIEHVLIKPVFRGTIIEINGKNAALSNVYLSGGTNNTPIAPFVAIIGIILLAGAIFAQHKHKQNKFSAKISAVDTENKILKVAFEKKDGLIAKSTGAKKMPLQPSNVRKVKFMEDINIRELNIK